MDICSTHFRTYMQNKKLFKLRTLRYLLRSKRNKCKIYITLVVMQNIR